MNGQKRFMIPGDLWDAALLEQWLEEKALQGWLPVSFGGLRGKFERSEPQALRFRLEPDQPESRDDRQEREAAYEEMGWRYTGTLGYYRVWSCADPNAPELYTDPSTLGWAWEQQLRKLRRNGLICVLLILLWTVLQFRQVWEGHPPVETFLYGMWAVWLFVLWWAGQALWETVRQLRAVRKLRTQLAAGIAPDHSGSVSKALRRRKRRELADWIAIGLLAMFCVSMAEIEELGDLTEAPGPLPYVSMETLDPESAAQKMDWQHYEENRDLLVPDRYEIEQFRWNFGPRLEARFDRVRFTWFAKLLYEERLAVTEREYPGLTRTEVEDPRFDQAVILTGSRGEEGRRIQIFLGRRGAEVLWEYTVLDTDLAAHLDDFAAVLTAFGERGGEA